MPRQRSADRRRTGDIGISRRAGGADAAISGSGLGVASMAHSASLILASLRDEIGVLIGADSPILLP